MRLQSDYIISLDFWTRACVPIFMIRRRKMLLFYGKSRKRRDNLPLFIVHKKRYNEQEKEVAMRKWKQNETVLQSVICNRCGKPLKVENGVLKEGCLQVCQTFGYFSAMDGTQVRFDLCEACYLELKKSFLIAPQEEEATELL